MKKILVLLGHPDKDSLSGHLADIYAKSAKEAGHKVKRINVGSLKFDPILHKGYKTVQKLESDLVKVQRAFKWANHIFIIYPNWWCTMPALLKGMFDRMFLPGFAFRFYKKKKGWRKLLEGRSARVVVLTGFYPLAIRFLFGDFTNEIGRGILGFSGIAPVRITKLGPATDVTEEKLESWRNKIKDFGRQAI